MKLYEKLDTSLHVMKVYIDAKEEPLIWFQGLQQTVQRYSSQGLYSKKQTT